ncbi:MAG: HrcA family transcriptional regulator, partial [Oscillospiraceae bacterium]
SRVQFQTTDKICDFFTKFANSSLGGKSFHEITVSYMQSIVGSLDEYSEIITVILSNIYELCKLISDGQLFVSGQNNLLSYKEFELVAYDLLSTMNDRQEMQTLVSDSEYVTVSIGKENANQTLTNATVLITKYKIGQTIMGAIGIVGPVRMDYAKRISHIEYFAENIGRILTEILLEE